MAVKTVTSTGTAYATGAQLTTRYDWRTLADLVTDDDDGSGRPSSASAVASDATIAAFLLEASGRVEAATLVGERYTATDLAALTGTAGGEFLARLVCDLAVGMLYRRRPHPAPPQFVQIEEAERLLGALAEGVKIFAFQETQDAGVMDDYIESPQDVEARQMATYTAQRFFGRRNNRVPRMNWGG